MTPGFSRPESQALESINLIQQISLLVLPVLFAITGHEAAHGWMAQRLGDPTAQRLGRLSFNPLRHIDPMGTVIVPLATFLLPKLLGGSGFLFGWAKPVPVNWRNLRHPRRDMALVAAAGPAANLLMAIFWALIIKLGLMLPGSAIWVVRPMVLMGSAGILINIILMALNLLPVLPLDGGRILFALLPDRAASLYGSIEPLGLIIVLLLLISGLLDKILYPMMDGIEALVRLLVGL